MSAAAAATRTHTFFCKTHLAPVELLRRQSVPALAAMLRLHFLYARDRPADVGGRRVDDVRLASNADSGGGFMAMSVRFGFSAREPHRQLVKVLDDGLEVDDGLDWN